MAIKKLEELPELCLNLKVHQFKSPNIEVYKCVRQTPCEHQFPYMGINSCRKAYPS
jgi:hypothetical protein